MDKLDMLFKKQYDLQVQGMHYDFDSMTTEQRAAYVKEYTLHCEHEMHEALQEIPFFKPWKRYDKDAVSEKNQVMWAMARKEFVDALASRETLEAAADQVRQSSRRYAKRQLTWFRRNKAMHWLIREKQTTGEDIFRSARQVLREIDK